MAFLNGLKSIDGKLFHFEMSFLIQAISFMLNMKIFYV